MSQSHVISSSKLGQKLNHWFYSTLRINQRKNVEEIL